MIDYLRQGRAFLSIALVLGFATTALCDGERSTPNPKRAGLDNEELAQVGVFMEGALEDERISGGTVMVSRRGKLGLFDTYGWENLETEKPVSDDSIFRIFSMSKAITTAAVLTLYEDGKLDLDDPVADHLPALRNLKVAGPDGLRDPVRPVTIRDLMLHTAGMTYGGLGPAAHQKAYEEFKPLEAANLEEMVERLSSIPLACDPGEKWTYGVSIDVLGRVAEVVSGKPLDVFLKETIFDPLGMKDTAFQVPKAKWDRLVVTYTPSSNGLQRVEVPLGIDVKSTVGLFSGGGGLAGTTRDYMRFLKMIEQGGKLGNVRILRKRTVRLMTNNQLPAEVLPIGFGENKRHGMGFGLGFAVRVEETEDEPAARLGEYGWGGAASTHYWISPSDRLIVVIMQQIIPYHSDTETGLKPIIYNAIRK